MAETVLIYGKSGAGKSRSMKNLPPEETAVIQTIPKRLPFKSSLTTMTTCDVGIIEKAMNKAVSNGKHIIVIDDAGYIMTEEFMSKHARAKNQFDMYNKMADDMHYLINASKALPEDVTVYIMMHEYANDNGDVKLRTIGKLLDDKVCLEGMVTITLRCVTKGKNHYFRTTTDGWDITKTPEDMFDNDEIENDLRIVDKTIRSYYGIGGIEYEEA